MVITSFGLVCVDVRAGSAEVDSGCLSSCGIVTIRCMDHVHGLGDTASSTVKSTVLS